MTLHSEAWLLGRTLVALEQRPQITDELRHALATKDSTRLALAVLAVMRTARRSGCAPRLARQAAAAAVRRARAECESPRRTA